MPRGVGCCFTPWNEQLPAERCVRCWACDSVADSPALSCTKGRAFCASKLMRSCDCELGQGQRVQITGSNSPSSASTTSASCDGTQSRTCPKFSSGHRYPICKIIAHHRRREVVDPHLHARWFVSRRARLKTVNLKNGPSRLRSGGSNVHRSSAIRVGSGRVVV